MSRERISLAYLQNRKLLERIADTDPSLIYFICFRGNRLEFPIDSRILDIEQACRELSKFDLMIFNPPHNRNTHVVTERDCNLTRQGKSVFNELIENNICQTIRDQLDFSNNEAFTQSFFDIFTFEEDPTQWIENKRLEIQKYYNISLAPNNHHFKNGHITYFIDNNVLFVRIDLICNCGTLNHKDIEQENLIDACQNYHPHQIVCEHCGNEYWLSPNLYFIY